MNRMPKAGGVQTALVRAASSLTGSPALSVLTEPRLPSRPAFLRKTSDNISAPPRTHVSLYLQKLLYIQTVLLNSESHFPLNGDTGSQPSKPFSRARGQPLLERCVLGRTTDRLESAGKEECRDAQDSLRVMGETEVRTLYLQLRPELCVFLKLILLRNCTLCSLTLTLFLQCLHVKKWC